MSEREPTGHTIVDGELQHLSVSSLEKGDRNAGGCERRWNYWKRQGKTAEESAKGQKSKEAGTKLHAELEHYERTGENVLGRLAQKGLHFIPDPGPDLRVETPIHKVIQIPDGTSVLGPNGDIVHGTRPRVVSPLTAAGIPFAGYIDLWHRRGINKGADDITELHDPPGTIEVMDWKWKGNVVDRYGNSTLISRDKLVYTTQMAGYGEWIRRTIPDAHYIRLSHGVFPDKGGAPRKITKLHVVQDCSNTWEYVETVARTLRDVAKESNVDKVPANLMACTSYGGCPHAEYCTARQNNSMSRLFGETAEQELQQELGSQLMGLFEQVAPDNVQQQLAQEEANLRAQQQQVMNAPAPQATVALPPPVTFTEMTYGGVPAPARADGTQVYTPPPARHPLLDTWDAILAYGRGQPALGGEAAQTFAAAKGYAFNGSGFAGTGQLGTLTLFNSAQLTELLNDMKTKLAPVPAAQTFSPIAQEVAQAVVAALPTAPVPTALPPQTMPVGMPSMLPPEAPPSIPALAAAPVLTPGQAAETPVAPKKRGRPKNPDSAPQPTAVAATTPTPSAFQGAASQATPVVGADAGTFEVYVDCIPNCESTSLSMYVHTINQVLAKKFCIGLDGKPTTQDVRCAPKDSPLAFGGWEGAIFDLVLTNPPPAGVYTIETGSKLHAVVASALEVICAQRGALFVKGIR